MKSSRSHLSWLLVWGLVSGALLPPWPCVARSKNAAGAARALYQKGAKLYQEKRYEEALSAFQKAFAHQQLPRLLYKMAQAHFQLGHADESIRLYERFLQLEPTPPADILSQVNDDLAQARKRLQAAAAIQNPPEPTIIPKETPPAQLPEPLAQVPIPNKAETPPAAQKPARVDITPAKMQLTQVPIPQAIERPQRLILGRPAWRVGTGAALTALGLGALSTGSVALGYHGQCGTAPVPPVTECDQVYQTLIPGISLAAGGGALVAIGVSLALWPHHAPREGKRTAQR